MRASVTLAVCVVALLVPSAGAQAAPEIGRCEAKSGGKYTSANCNVKAKTGTGTFEFNKGAAGHLAFTVGSGELVQEGASGTNIVCTASTATGKYKEANGKINSVEQVVWTLTGCGIPAFGVRCNTRGQPPETFVFYQLKGKLGYLAGEHTASPTLGLQLEPANKKAFGEFECGGGAVNVVIDNCVISELTPANTMSTTIAQVLETAGDGHQKWTSFEKAPLKQCQLESSLNGGPREPVGLLVNATLTSEIALMVHGI